jgi:hypothetical protein
MKKGLPSRSLISESSSGGLVLPLPLPLPLPYPKPNLPSRSGQLQASNRVAFSKKKLSNDGAL